MSAGGNPAFVPVRNVRAFFSVVTNASGPVGKMYNYDGVELKKRTLAQIYDGEARLREVTTLEEFLAIRKKLTTRQALCFGVPRGHSKVCIAKAPPRSLPVKLWRGIGSTFILPKDGDFLHRL